MKMHIALLAVCAGTFAVVQAGMVLANVGGGLEFKNTAAIENAIRLAATTPIPGVDVIVKKKSLAKTPDGSKTGNSGKALPKTGNGDKPGAPINTSHSNKVPTNGK
jgi:hypothetical protein